MPNVVGFEKGYWVKTCVRCGNVFRTRNGDKPHCNVCTGRIAQAERLHEMSAYRHEQASEKKANKSCAGKVKPAQLNI